MAFGRKKKQTPQSVQQPSGVKVDRTNNPFYPPRKESLMKEIGTTLGVVFVCVLLAGVIITNFNYMAIASRQDAKSNNNLNTQEANIENSNTQEANIENPIQNEYPDEEVEEVEEVPEESIPENSGKVVVEVMPTPTPVREVINGDYIIPDSNIRYITEADLENLTQDELRIARNEIYARHGRLFKDAALQAYFNSKDWYTGRISPDDFTQEMLSNVERANAAAISDFETRKGY